VAQDAGSAAQDAGSAAQDAAGIERVIQAWLNEFFYVEEEGASWTREIRALLEGPGAAGIALRATAAEAIALRAIARWIKTTGSMTGARAKAIALHLLELVKIPDPEQRLNQYIFQLSGGMRQRIMIAIAMACRPSLIIADEPTTALDVTIKGEVLDLLMELKNRLGISVILITHDLGIVASYADRIGVLYTGEFVEMGGVDDLFYRPRHPYTLGLLHSIPRLDIDQEGGLETIEGNPPNPLERPEGCAFADRCRYGLWICRSQRPPRKAVDETHWAACFLLDERAASAAIQSGYQENLP
jgi:oligopeptide transport system ATP-binding protein